MVDLDIPAGQLLLGKDIAAGILVIVAVLVLVWLGAIEGEVALMAILGVAGALGVYRGGKDRV